MNPIDAFRDLLMSLADVYAAEAREGAQTLVKAYRAAAETARPAPCPPFAPMDAVIRAASDGAEHPAAQAARTAHSLLPWSRTGKLDQQIAPEISDVFAVAILIGPGALIHHDTVLAGLFVQKADAFYPPHAHAAEETYAMLNGTAEWQRDFGDWQTRHAGDLIHHPSEAPHATRTGDAPILAAWRWSGDIRPCTYRMCECDVLSQSF